jgi:hypothetical protein
MYLNTYIYILYKYIYIHMYLIEIDKRMCVYIYNYLHIYIYIYTRSYISIVPSYHHDTIIYISIMVDWSHSIAICPVSNVSRTQGAAIFHDFVVLHVVLVLSIDVWIRIRIS